MSRRRALAVTRTWALGLSAGIIVLLPPVLAPALAPSAYLFGVGAVAASALLGSTTSAVVTGVLAALDGVILERAAGGTGSGHQAQGLLFVFVAGGIVLLAGQAAAARRQLADALGKLERREALLNSVLETGADAMLVIDSEGVISSFSTSAEALFGWKKAEIVGRNINVLTPPAHHREQDNFIAQFLQPGERRIIGKNQAVTGLRKDGTQFPMALHVGEVRVGDEIHFTGFAHDLTELTDAQSRSEELRTQLNSVWRMNSLGEMAAMLAHELNQPLSAISNYMRGARSIAHRLELKDDDLVDALEMAAAQAVRAGEIIRRARAAVAREEVEHTLESLFDLISETELMLGIMAREGQVALRFNLAPEPCVVRVDRIQIQQVIGNLVRNAVDAMKGSKERVLEISSHQRGDCWVVTIADSGPGIPPDKAAQLFEPMTTSKQGGMGLGLSISRNIVERHGGALWFKESHLGGAAFCFSLLNEPDG